MALSYFLKYTSIYHGHYKAGVGGGTFKKYNYGVVEKNTRKLREEIMFRGRGEAYFPGLR